MARVPDVDYPPDDEVGLLMEATAISEEEGNDDSAIIFSVNPQEEDRVAYDVSHVPKNPQAHVLAIGYAFRDIMDQIKDPYDVFDVDMTKLTKGIKDLYNDRDIWFTPAEKSSVISSVSRVSDMRFLSASFFHVLPKMTRIKVLLIRPSRGLIMRLAAYQREKGLTLTVAYVSPAALDRAGGDLNLQHQARWYKDIASVPNDRQGWDLILVDFSSRELYREDQIYIDSIDAKRSVDGVIVFRVADVNMIKLGAVQSAKIVSDHGEYSSVRMHNRIFEDYHIRKEYVQRFLGQTFDGVTQFDHAGITNITSRGVFNVKGVELPDMWKLQHLFVCSKRPLLHAPDRGVGDPPATIDMRPVFLNRPTALDQKGLDLLTGLRFVVKPKHDGFPAVGLYANGYCNFFRVKTQPGEVVFEDLPEHRYASGPFSGFVQVEVVVGDVETLYYIDYYGDGKGSFEHRRSQFVKAVGESLSNVFPYTYKLLNHENIVNYLQDFGEGAVFQLLDVPLVEHAVCSFYAKRDPTIDVTWDQVIGLGGEVPLYDGVKEYSLTWEFKRDRPDKTKGNSKEEIKRVRNQVEYQTAIMTLTDPERAPGDKFIWDSGGEVHVFSKRTDEVKIQHTVMTILRNWMDEALVVPAHKKARIAGAAM